ncbi:MAG: hypothetical protein ABI175_16190, partial [Polyangiales bacterium]
RGDRRVTITCPPSTAYVIELHDGATLVASGSTLEDDAATAVAAAWLDGTALAALIGDSPFVRAATV